MLPNILVAIFGKIFGSVPTPSSPVLTITDRSRQLYSVTQNPGQLYALAQNPRNLYDVEDRT